jgi:hypothetical protein
VSFLHKWVSDLNLLILGTLQWWTFKKLWI